MRSCLSAIQRQKFPASQYEIIVVDDYSTDNTCEIAREFGAAIVKSGHRHIERSKAIGIQKSKGKYIFFIDADIELIEKDILALSVALLEKTPAFGVQIVQWQYAKSHSLYDRYCELFGVNNPLTYMLGRRGVLSPYESTWMDEEAVIKEGKDYSLITLELPVLRTFGSQGFMIRRSAVEKLRASKYFFHLDAVSQLVSKGTDKLIILKRRIRHTYVDSFYQFHKKLYRNMILYFKYKTYRTYSYGASSIRFPFVLFAMGTIVIPLYQSIRGYVKIQDPAWFLHPVFCITVPIVHAYATIEWYIKSALSPNIEK